MVTLHIDVSSPQNAAILVSLLQSVSFVEAVRVEPAPADDVATPDMAAEDLFGIWKDRDITLDTLRDLAWNKRQ